MSSVAYWEDYQANDRRRRQRNLAAADPAGWEQHTPYHWSRQLDGSKLEYWPSRRKFAYRGVVRRGDVGAFIRRYEGKGPRVTAVVRLRRPRWRRLTVVLRRLWGRR